MRVTILGQFGTTDLASSYARGFRRLGCEVVEVDYLSSIGRVGSRIGADRVGRWSGAAYRYAKSLDVISRVPPSDLILVIKGHFLSPSVYSALRTAARCPVVCFNPDNPFNLNGASSFAHVLEAIPQYDVYFVWSHALVPQVREAGAGRAEFLAFGVDDEHFFPEHGDATPEVNLGFIGNWDPERERWLEAAAPLGLAVWGADWDRAKSPLIRKAWRGHQVTDRAFRRTAHQARIQLNVLRVQNKGGHNMRTFELPACGVPVLAEWSAELELFFSESEVSSFRTPQDLVSKAERLLADELALKDMASRALRRVAEHTYQRRALEILQAVGLEVQASHLLRQAEGNQR